MHFLKHPKNKRQAYALLHLGCFIPNLLLWCMGGGGHSPNKYRTIYFIELSVYQVNLQLLKPGPTYERV